MLYIANLDFYLQIIYNDIVTVHTAAYVYIIDVVMYVAL